MRKAAERIALAYVMPWRNIEKTGIQAFMAAPIGTGAYRWTTADFNNGLKWTAMPASMAPIISLATAIPANG